MDLPAFIAPLNEETTQKVSGLSLSIKTPGSALTESMSVSFRCDAETTTFGQFRLISDV